MDEICPKRLFPVQNRKCELRHWTKFQLKLKIFIFWTKFAQNGGFWSKTEKSHLCVSMVVTYYTKLFSTRHNGTLMFFLLLVTERKTKWLILGTYRPPNQPIDYFFENVDNVFDIYSRENDKFLLWGDCNSELTKPRLEKCLLKYDRRKNLVLEKSFFKIQKIPDALWYTVVKVLKHFAFLPLVYLTFIK